MIFIFLIIGAIFFFVLASLLAPKKSYNYKKRKQLKYEKSKTLDKVLSSNAKFMHQHREKLFTNFNYGVAAKPDDIVLDNGKYHIVEFKNRHRGIYQSDINQSITTLLACRSHPKYKYMRNIIIYNEGGEIKQMTLPSSDEKIFKMIKYWYDIAIDIKYNKACASKNLNMCFACKYRKNCN